METQEESNLVKHAKRELAILMGDHSDEPENAAMSKHIIHMVEEFSKEGHSGFSAQYAISLLDRLLKFEPITPLTGDDEEWREVDGWPTQTKVFQNTRCSRVFKEINEDDISVYDVQGKVFVEPDGAAFTNSESCVSVEFPYYPRTEYVYLTEEPEKNAS